MHRMREIDFGETYINRENFEAMQGFHAGHGRSGIGGAVALSLLMIPIVVRSTEEMVDPPEQTYTVKKGDTLSAIAKQFYGKASAWPRIFEANRDQIDDPDKIFPGQVLRIPARED